MIAYYKWDQAKENHLLIVANIDPYYKQSGSLKVPYKQLGIPLQSPIIMKDQISGNTYTCDSENYVFELPPELPYYLFIIEILR